METTTLQFYYPTHHKYPVDPVCEKIVSALETRNWCVPGIKVEFDDTRVGSTIFRKVSKITGATFQIWFCRRQGYLRDRYFNTAAVTQINIPKKQLNVFSDHSGPSFVVYVGKNWEKENDEFVNRSKRLAKIKGEPRTYLRYSGEMIEGVKYLVSDNDLKREYSPENKEPAYYKIDEVFQEFVSYLEESVLKVIENI